MPSANRSRGCIPWILLSTMRDLDSVSPFLRMWVSLRVCHFFFFFFTENTRWQPRPDHQVWSVEGWKEYTPAVSSPQRGRGQSSSTATSYDVITGAYPNQEAEHRAIAEERRRLEVRRGTERQRNASHVLGNEAGTVAGGEGGLGSPRRTRGRMGERERAGVDPLTGRFTLPEKEARAAAEECRARESALESYRSQRRADSILSFTPNPDPRELERGGRPVAWDDVSSMVCCRRMLEFSFRDHRQVWWPLSPSSLTSHLSPPTLQM